MGELKFEGLTVLKEDFVRGFFKTKEDEVYNDSRFKKAYEKLRDVYGSLGYFQWTGGTERKPDAERKVVDVTVRMEEDKQYFVGKLSFTGNDSTRDKVIRREIYMNEGDVFNTEALKMSIKRVNQLGYFKAMESAPGHQAQRGRGEQGRRHLQGRGAEPQPVHLRRRRLGLRGHLHQRIVLDHQLPRRGRDVPDLRAERQPHQELLALGAASRTSSTGRSRRASTSSSARSPTTATPTSPATRRRAPGASLVTGFLVGKWSRAFLNYTYEVIKLSEADPADVTNPFFPGTGGVTTGTGPAYDPLLFGDYADRTESRLTPNLVYNTVDNPYTPRAGMRHTATFMFAGGPLGGTVNYYRPSLEAIVYQPIGRKMALGMRAEVALIQQYGDTQVLPLYQRYFLGGETQIRGYDIRSVGPVDSQGRVLGGNKFGLFNAEYYFDVFGPLRALLFFDAGQAFLEGQPIDVSEFRISTGAELRFIMPVLNVPFRLIYAFNPNRKTAIEKLYTPYSTFKFAVGTTF